MNEDHEWEAVLVLNTRYHRLRSVSPRSFLFKSGIFARHYWWTMLIIFAFQIPVDGWLTKLSAPIVIYNPDEILGLRAPWDIPIEDFGFGFAMVTLAILLWRRWLDRKPAPEEAIARENDHERGRCDGLRRGAPDTTRWARSTLAPCAPGAACRRLVVAPETKIASSMPEPVEGRLSHLWLLDLGCGSGASTRLCRAVEAADLDFPSWVWCVAGCWSRRASGGLQMSGSKSVRRRRSLDRGGFAMESWSLRRIRNLGTGCALAGLFDLLSDGGVRSFRVLDCRSRRAGGVTAVCCLVIIRLAADIPADLSIRLWRSVVVLRLDQTFIDRLIARVH
jgi:lycopene cyclase domain-containing protein